MVAPVMWRILVKLLTRLQRARDYSNRMRLTMAHVRWAVIIAAWALLAFVAMRAADGLIGPFTPGVVSAIFCAVGILLLRRYGPAGPVDPRRRRIWLLSSVAAGGALSVLGLIAAMWMAQMHSVPAAACPGQSFENTCANAR